MGDSVTLADGVGVEAPNLTGFSVSSNGRVAYRTGAGPRNS